MHSESREKTDTLNTRVLHLIDKLFSNCTSISELSAIDGVAVALFEKRDS